MGALKEEDTSGGKKEKRIWAGIFGAGLILGLILRFYLATFAQTPGHGDPAFYYTLAKNIATAMRIRFITFEIITNCSLIR